MVGNYLPIVVLDYPTSSIEKFENNGKPIAFTRHSVMTNIWLVHGYLIQEGAEDGQIFLCFNKEEADLLARKQAEAVYGAKPWVILHMGKDEDFVASVGGMAEEIKSKVKNIGVRYLGEYF